MGRIDYYCDPTAPPANSLVPGASAIVVNDQGKILLQKRRDNSRWALPSGVMEIGETIAETAVREVKEETGFEVEPEYIVGVYSDPNHLMAYDDGEVRQEFSVCFVCRIVGGALHVGDEALQVDFFSPEDLGMLDIHPSVRRRISDFFSRFPRAVMA